MNRREAVLRELNLYPLWVRRNSSVASGSPVPAMVQVSEPDTLPENVNAATQEIIPEPQIRTKAEVKQQPELAGMDWQHLRQAVKECSACRLRAGCTQTVFGVGDEKAEWLFVGEGPGADEDALGEPFVGQTGKLLDNMLMALQLKRGQNTYIANIVKCRPPENHAPEADEIAQCLPYLQRQIELIQPKLIVALGKTAAQALLQSGESVGAMRGKLHDFQGIPLVVTYHPAYLLRSPSEKASAWLDLCLARDTIIKTE